MLRAGIKVIRARRACYVKYDMIASICVFQNTRYVFRIFGERAICSRLICGSTTERAI